MYSLLLYSCRLFGRISSTLTENEAFPFRVGDYFRFYKLIEGTDGNLPIEEASQCLQQLEDRHLSTNQLINALLDYNMGNIFSSLLSRSRILPGKFWSWITHSMKFRIKGTFNALLHVQKINFFITYLIDYKHRVVDWVENLWRNSFNYIYIVLCPLNTSLHHTLLYHPTIPRYPGSGHNGNNVENFCFRNTCVSWLFDPLHWT